MIKAAGVLIFQNNLVLAAYNPRSNMWSGIGGKIEQDETPQEAAFRETIEELFGLTPSKAIINEMVAAFSNSPLLQRDDYAYIPVRFDLLIHLIYVLKAHNYVSPYYYTLPDTVADLVHQRKAPEDAEITDLKFVDYINPATDVSEDLLLDCQHMYRNP